MDPAATTSHYPERCIDSFDGNRNSAHGDGFFLLRDDCRFGSAVSGGKGAT
jgi:hypothetical protein